MMLFIPDFPAWISKLLHPNVHIPKKANTTPYAFEKLRKGMRRQSDRGEALSFYPGTFWGQRWIRNATVRWQPRERSKKRLVQMGSRKQEGIKSDLREGTGCPWSEERTAHLPRFSGKPHVFQQDLSPLAYLQVQMHYYKVRGRFTLRESKELPGHWYWPARDMEWLGEAGWALVIFTCRFFLSLDSFFQA